MPITVEELDNNQQFKELDTEVKNQFVTFYNNNEATALEAHKKTVANERTAEIYTGLDKDIEEVTGFKKPEGVHTYDNLKDVLKKLQTQATAAGAEKEKLSKQIAEGKLDEAAKAQLTELRRKVGDQETVLSSLRNKYEADTLSLRERLSKERESNILKDADFAFTKAQTGISFKSDDNYPAATRDALVKLAMNELLKDYKPGGTQTVNGKDELVFRSKKDDTLLVNPNNLGHPMTATDWLLSNEPLKPFIGSSSKGGGGGAGAGGSRAGAGKGLDISGVTTRVEADRAIRKHIAQDLGIAQGTKAFVDKFNEIAKEKGIRDLPES